MEYFNAQKTTREFGDEVWFPCQKELEEREIKFQHLIQKPGDAMYTGYNTIHWVFNP